MIFLRTIDCFWPQHPALLFGLSILIGFYASQELSYSLGFATAFILFPIYLNRLLFQKLLLVVLLILTTFLYGKIVHTRPLLPPEGIEGDLYFDIASVNLNQTHFGCQWVYKGSGKKFIPLSNQFSASWGKNFPCSLAITQNTKIERPIGNRSYIIRGVLKKTSRGGFHFYFKPQLPWKMIKNSWSLAEVRYQSKTWLKSWIAKRIPDSQSAEFIGGIITGDFEDKVMKNEFGKVGLLHIMAISGFHFALVALMLQTALRLFFPIRIAVGILIFLLSVYFIFLGCGPSIVRAWVMALVGFLSLVVEKPSLGMNSLGVSVLLIFLIDPHLLLSIGFQFSAITTAAILMWYPICEQFLRSIWVARPLGKIIKMDWLDQHLYFAISLFRQAVALACAVNIVAIPSTLFFFHKFPLISFVYNLFIPFLVSISMFLFLLGGCLDFILQGSCSLLHAINAYVTHFLLNSIYHLPPNFNCCWRVDPFSSVWLTALLCAIFGIGALITTKLPSTNA